MNLTPAQIANLAAAAGFQGNDLTTAVAVALAESQGNPNAYNPESQKGTPAGKGSVGLWQIYQNVHPEFAGWNLNDPATNAAAAFSTYTGAGNTFQPWATFTSGKYLSYMDAAQAGVIADANSGVVIDAASGLATQQQLSPNDLSQVPVSVWVGIALFILLMSD